MPSAAPAGRPAVSAESRAPAGRGGLAAAPQPGAHVLSRRGAEAPARPDGAAHPGRPAGPVAGDLRRDLQPDPRHPHRQPALPELPGAGHHRPVRPVRRHFLRHPDHLGTRRRRADQAARHPDAPRPRSSSASRSRPASGRSPRWWWSWCCRPSWACTLSSNPCTSSGAFVVVMLGSAFFSCLSMTVAGVVLKRDRLMGIGQMITMPLFFASNALYPVTIMPGWLRVLSKVNPLSYEVDALRGMLTGASGPRRTGLCRARRLGRRRRRRPSSSLVGRLAR